MDVEELKRLGWPEDRERAADIQRRIAEKVVIAPLVKAPRTVAGVDAAFSGGTVIAAACLYSYPELEKLDESSHCAAVRFPYIPGLLSFREGPAVIEAVRGLYKRPDILIFDGQGIAHPRGLGIASLAGVMLGIPSVGTAKSRLVGEYKTPAAVRGSFTELEYKGKVVGSVLRTRDNVAPLFVSPGHLADVESSVRLVLGCTRGYRLTEPVRCADRLSKKLAREHS